MAPEQKMFHNRTEPTLFQAGTLAEMVPVRSLLKTGLYAQNNNMLKQKLK